MRTITDHIVERDNAPQLTIIVLDEPGAGGANHEYSIQMTSAPGQKVFLRGDGSVDEEGRITQEACRVSFQNGPIQEMGINGVTQEALLAIVIDRLRSFQAGPFPHEFNQGALMHCEAALHFLQRRTRERIARGVEGKTVA